MSRALPDPDESGNRPDTWPGSEGIGEVSGGADGFEAADPDGQEREVAAGDLAGRMRRSSDDETIREQLREASAAAFRRVGDSAPPGVRARLRAFRERIRSRRALDTVWRVMVFTIGITFVVAGLIMFVIPGPGFATVILGLVILGSEFTWATRALNPMKDAARRAQEAALDPRRRRRNLIVGAIAGVLVAIVALWYLTEYGPTIGPIMSWVDGVLDWVRGLFQ